jgi:hypothetical protein
MKKPAWGMVVSKLVWGLAIGAGYLLCGITTGCNLAKATTPGMNVTQAYQTVAARLTQALETRANQTLQPAPPLETPRSSPTPPASLPQTPDLPPATRTLTPTLVCDRAAAGNPIDITIPDDTSMQPGQSFTKIWRLLNVGSCRWTAEYGVRFFYGAQMSAQESVLLKGAVNPGEEIEIAVDMTAPQSPGVHQGNWKLQNATGQLFGIGPNGDAPFWVRIIVQEPPTATPTQTNTATATSTPTPTITPTPVIQSSGAVVMKLGGTLDLDSGELNGERDFDLLYQSEANGLHQLLPQGSALLGVLGSNEPGPQQCQAATKSTAPLALESLPPGTYLCFQTNENRNGWLRYNSLNASDSSADLYYRTWVQVP